MGHGSHKNSVCGQAGLELCIVFSEKRNTLNLDPEMRDEMSRQCQGHAFLVSKWLGDAGSMQGDRSAWEAGCSCGGPGSSGEILMRHWAGVSQLESPAV